MVEPPKVSAASEPRAGSVDGALVAIFQSSKGTTSWPSATKRTSLCRDADHELVRRGACRVF